MSLAFNLSNIQKSYTHFALQDISLSLETGQIMGMVGVNGAGKTTLLRILMGLVVPDQGQVEVLGWSLPDQQVRAKQEIGFASEDMRLYPSQSLAWHMDFIAKIYPHWDQAYAQSLLERFDLRPEQLMRGMSHGQRVKSMLLLSLARRPKLLFLDEPTTGLDPVARAEVLEAMADVLRDETRSVLFSSHNTHDIEQLSDVISFLHQGKLLASENKDSFLNNWRRILCQGKLPTAALPESVFSVKQRGSLIELKINCYNEGILAELQTMGLQVQNVEAMNLEDVFVSTVREGSKQ
jgi:ABC-2 type transport system ATP-binding protein